MAGEQGIDGAFGHIRDAVSDGVSATRLDRATVYWRAAHKRADAAMYPVRNRGRDEVETSGSGSGP